VVSGDSASLVDARDPSAPRLLASLSDFVSDARVRGDLLYATGRNGLEIFDVEDPSAPVEQGGLAEGVGETLDLDGDHVYVAGRAAGLLVVDVSNPESPTLVARVEALEHAEIVEVAGSIAWVGGHPYGGVWAVDVSRPEAPAIVGWFSVPGPITDIALRGDTMFVAERDGLYVVDVSDPMDPRERCFFWWENATGVGVAEDGPVYLTSWLRGPVGVRFGEAHVGTP
jgi:hypothetical protein